MALEVDSSRGVRRPKAGRGWSWSQSCRRDDWRDYAGLYRARTAELITKGLHTSEEDYAAGLAQRETLRTTLASTAAEHGVDYWLTPGAPGACATLACSRAFADAQDACPQAPRPAA